MYNLQNKQLKSQFLQKPKQETNKILITQTPKINVGEENCISFGTFCGQVIQVITPRSLLGVIYRDLAIFFFPELRQTSGIKI